MKTKYDLESVREEILKLADTGYREFQIKLLPSAENFAGVRLPELRKIAKRIAKTDGREYLESALEQDEKEELFEEIMLQGMIIGYMKEDISGIFSFAGRFVPKIDNWSVCDSFCSGFKHAGDNKQKVWEWLDCYVRSAREFDIRFAVVMYLNYYIEDDYIRTLFPLLDGIKHDGYYVKMAVAWAVSICYVKYPQLCMEYLKNNKLDDWTYNKALQKITESHCVSKKEKDIIRQMKR